MRCQRWPFHSGSVPRALHAKRVVQHQGQRELEASCCRGGGRAEAQENKTFHFPLLLCESLCDSAHQSSIRRHLANRTLEAGALTLRGFSNDKCCSGASRRTSRAGFVFRAAPQYRRLLPSAAAANHSPAVSFELSYVDQLS